MLDDVFKSFTKSYDAETENIQIHTSNTYYFMGLNHAGYSAPRYLQKYVQYHLHSKSEQ